MSLLAGQVASGLDIKFYHNRVLTDPDSVTYIMYNASSTQMASGVGTKITTGHYDASASVIPSGYPAAGWKITWTYVTPNSISASVSETFTVVDTLSTSFNYSTGDVDDIIEDIKVDLGLTDEFTTSNYRRLIQKSLRRLNRRLRFTGTSDAMSYTSSTNSIAPALTDTLRDILVLQVECLISKERRRDAVGKGIKVKDGDTQIDTTASFRGHDSVVSDFCGDLDEAIKDYLLHEVDSPADHAEVIWYGSRKLEADMEHDGEGSYDTIVYESPFENRVGLSVSLD